MNESPLLRLAGELLRHGQRELALSLPDALWLARLLPAPEQPVVNADEQTEPDSAQPVSGGAPATVPTD
ncbi:MAG: hypothetical protein J5I93_22025, partial [Pirellulaceae bacterium]|nr:hypothetical protein [Pirellulaceae bacterium]